MKTTITLKSLALCFMACCFGIWGNLYATMVTFSVDMNEYAGTADYLTEGVTLNGSFNDWCGACAMMMDGDSDGVYELSIDLAEGFYEYKFTIGPWTDQEMLMVGIPCTMTSNGNTNRTVTVGVDPVVQETVCWNSCYACGVAAPTSDVTFSVDMNEYAGTADYLTEGVTLNGTFNGWCGACAMMDDSDSDGVYEITIPIAEGSHEYKFTIGPWTDQEMFTVGMACTITANGNTNRTVTVGADPVIQSTVCWNSCNECGFVAPMSDVTFSVDMNQYAGPTDYLIEGVTLNGTFNGWCGACAMMDDSDSDGVYEITIPIEEGNHDYKFTIGAWIDQEILIDGMPCTITNNEGNTNRTVTVGAEPVVQATVCWNSCDACGIEPPMSDVTFSVDMNQYAGPADYLTEGVTLNGTFNGWCGACAMMDDSDSDGVYDITIPIAEGNHDYKFTIGPWTDQEMLIDGMPCTTTNNENNTNRTVTVGAEPVVQPAVCWNSCDACGIEPLLADVTFVVDMNDYAGTADYLTEGVTLNGTFNNWCGACAMMDDSDADGVYEITIPLAEGFHEYKFTIGPWTDQEMLIDGSSCTMTTDGNTNRTLTLGTEDMILDEVCWNACVTCNEVVIIPQYNVTFQVDMNGYDGPEDYQALGVNVNGTFNGWCGECWSMTDADTDGVYDFTALVDSGLVEFKYVVGNWVEDETFVGGEPCTYTAGDFWNRGVLDLNEDTVMDVVCWNLCEECQGELDPCTDPSAIICDNIDEYPLGIMNGQGAHWSTWSGVLGGEEDGIISNEQAFSNGHSLLIKEGQDQDVVLLLGDESSGMWTLDWMMYVPAGATAYYNFQGAPIPGDAYIVEILFNEDGLSPGEATLDVGGSFTYPEDQWFSVQHEIDLTNDLLVLTIDGTEVATLPYTSADGDLLSSIDFWSIDDDNRYYIDDVVFNGMPDSVSELATSSFTAYPNPTQDALTIVGQDKIDRIVVSSVLGSKVLDLNVTTGNRATINLSALQVGTYMVEVYSEGLSSVQRIVKQ